MLNFLTQNNRRKIVTEYIFRVSIFFFVFICISTLFLISLFLPSVFFSKYKNETIHRQLESMTVIYKNKNEDPIQLIKNINAMVTIFSRTNSMGIPISDIIKKIVSLKNNNIRITNISVSENSDLSKTFVLRGVSQTRDGLTSFNNNLRSNSTFFSVDLPIANLIRDINTDFTITLIYKNNTLQ